MKSTRRPRDSARAAPKRQKPAQVKEVKDLFQILEEIAHTREEKARHEETLALLLAAHGDEERAALLRERSHWSCALGIPSCKSARHHAPHADVETLLLSESPVPPEVLTVLCSGSYTSNARVRSEHFLLLVDRPELSGTQRATLTQRVETPEEWKAVLTKTTLPEARRLAKRPAPDRETLALLLKALQGDLRSIVEQLMAQRRAKFVGGYLLPSPPVEEQLALLRTIPAVRLAEVVLTLPCPSGTWSAPLVLGTVKKLLGRLPAEKKEAALEILLTLAENWTGSVAELVDASSALSL